jgi:hypothetical protein
MFGLVTCQEEFIVDPTNYRRSPGENIVKELSINDLEGNWNPVRISPYSQVTDFNLSSIKIRIKDQATCCNLGLYFFECNKKPWNCDKSVFSVDLENKYFSNPLKVSINSFAIENYSNYQELEVEFLVPMEYFNNSNETSTFETYKQLRIIFQK